MDVSTDSGEWAFTGSPLTFDNGVKSIEHGNLLDAAVQWREHVARGAPMVTPLAPPEAAVAPPLDRLIDTLAQRIIAASEELTALDSAIGDDRYLARPPDRVDDRGHLRHPHPGDDPGGADAPRTDPHLDRIHPAADHLPGSILGGHVPRCA